MRTVGLWAAIFALLAGPAIIASAQNYYPVEVGNRWVLRSTDGFDTKVNRIAGEELLGDQVVRVIESQTNDNPPDRLYVAVDDGAIWLYRAEARLGNLDLTFTYSPPQKFLPIPLQLGTTWTVQSETTFAGSPVSTTNRGEVVAIEDVTVPAGHFPHVFKIRQDVTLRTPLGSFPLESYLWLATDVGVVKEINTSEVTFELVEYEVTLPEQVSVDPYMTLPACWAAMKADVP